MTRRGGNSLHSGKRYEEIINAIVKSVLLNGIKPIVKENTAGAGRDNDITFTYENKQVSIEVKNKGAFEGGGKTLNHDGTSWIVSNNCFMKTVIGNENPYDGKIPSCFSDKKISTWTQEKNMFGDIYIKKSDSIVSDYYRDKGSSYIQIKDMGLYHTGLDVLDLGVPLFTVPTMLRIRVTKHMKSGIPTDVTAAFVFKRKDIVKSEYCLETKLPVSMKVE